MRILGIDYGEKRLGLAVSDELGISAHPLTTVRNTKENGSETIQELVKLVENNDIEKIVIGLPINLDGTDSQMTVKTRKFAEEIGEFINLPTEFWDERLTTKEVDRRLIEFDYSRSKRKKIRDKLSACVLLQSYLQAHSQK